jgi:AraC-like DNA-binding protein
MDQSDVVPPKFIQKTTKLNSIKWWFYRAERSTCVAQARLGHHPHYTIRHDDIPFRSLYIPASGEFFLCCKISYSRSTPYKPRERSDSPLNRVAFSNSNNKYKIPRHVSEALLSSYVHIFRHITEGNLNLVEVRFKHARPENTAQHERFFHAPLLFEQPANELVISKDILELPIFLANPGLLKPLEQIAQKFIDNLYLSDTLSDRVTRLLSKLLARGKRTNIETIATNLAMSVRNMQIKLKEEGTSYQRILDSVRKEIALSYLNEEDVTICDIAFLLGFSEQNAFNHAFKRWTGGSPKHYFKKKADTI